MRKLFLMLAAFVLAIAKSPAEETNGAAPLKIGTIDATNHYDEEMIVTGKVAQVTIRPSVTFLNIDEKYPDSPFTVVIIHAHSSFYGNANALKGKSIEIRGKIKNYHDKPEIALDSTDQLTVLGVTNLDVFLKPVKPSTGVPVTPSPTNAPPAAPSTNSLPEVM